MFESLGDRLTGVFDRLSGRGVLSEKDVDEALREVRLALLDADVALPVVRDFIDRARKDATGEAVIRAVRPANQVVKIVHDGLVDMLGGGGEPMSRSTSRRCASGRDPDGGPARAPARPLLRPSWRCGSPRWTVRRS